MSLPANASLPIRLSADQIAAISRAVGDARRFAILRQIGEQPSLWCSSLQLHECLSPATVSHHLKELQTAGLVSAERDGRVMKLTLNRDVWAAYVRELAALDGLR